MRLTSDMFVSALLRRVSGSGGFGAIVRRGNSEAGAIIITSRARDGEVTLLTPAAQSFYDEAKPNERCFSLSMQSSDQYEIDAKLEKETRFDPDAWIVEIEPGSLAISDLVTVEQ